MKATWTAEVRKAKQARRIADALMADGAGLRSSKSMRSDLHYLTRCQSRELSNLRTSLLVGGQVFLWIFDAAFTEWSFWASVIWTTYVRRARRMKAYPLAR